MTLPGYRLQTFGLSASPTATQVLQASSTRSRVLLSVQPGTGFAVVSPDAGVTDDSGNFVGPDQSPLELCVEAHGALAQAPLFATASGVGVRLTVVEVFGIVGGGKGGSSW